MNMYKLKDLKIVTYNTNEYYMCEYKDDCYTELFSNKKLDPNNILEVENLSDYYSTLDILSGMYKGDLESLFLKYNLILKYKYYLNNEETDKEYDRIDKSIELKYYQIDKLCYIETENEGNKRCYIGKYSLKTNNYIDAFTKKKISERNITNYIPLNKFDICYHYRNDEYPNIISSFDLLKIYNNLYKFNFIRYDKNKIYHKKKI